jgi:hypothetical protein
MNSLPTRPPAVYRLDVASPSPSHPDDRGTEPHFEEPPDTSILSDFQATQVSFVVTGALVPGHHRVNPAPQSNPELIEVANRCLQKWFTEYRKSR